MMSDSHMELLDVSFFRIIENVSSVSLCLGNIH